jgi:putative copper resistance protein D
MLDAATALARLVHLTAAMILFGSSLLVFYAPPMSHGLIVDSRQRGLLVLAGAVALISGLALAACTVIGLVGPGGLTHAGDLRDIFLGTPFGVARLVQLALTTAALIAAARYPKDNGLVIGLGAAALLSLAWIGHGAMGEGLMGDVRLSVQGAHLLAAAMWLGALPTLAWMLAQARREDAWKTADAALERFSVIGIAAVTIILVTGVANAIFILRSPTDLVATVYGRLLLIKLAGVAGLIGLAVQNRLSLMPKLEAAADADHGAWLSRLQRNVVIEQLLGLGVLAAVSLLGMLSPHG